MRHSKSIAVFLVIFISSTFGCIRPEDPVLDGDILAIGDSFLDYHAPDADIASIVGASLGLDVDLLAFGGATMLNEYSIADTYVDREHALLIVSGGGNDLEGCVCGESCEGMIDELISEDGVEGAIPDLVYRALGDGVYVVWVGYMRPMADADEYADCGGELDVLRDRLQLLDGAEDDLIFVDGALIGTGIEEHLYDPDGYHPSPEGCVVLGEEVAERVEDAFGLSAIE